MTTRSGAVLFSAAALSMLSFVPSSFAVSCENYGAHLREVNRLFHASPFAPSSLEVSGDRMWVAYHHGGYGVVDVSDPADPAVLATFDTSQTIERIRIAGNLAYFLADELLEIHDVTDPLAPAFVGSLGLPDNVRDLTLTEDWAVVSTRTTLEILDVSNPSQPTLQASHGLGMEPREGVAVGNVVYYATSQGLKIWDLTTPSSLVLVGESVELLDFWRLEKVDDVVYGAVGGIATWDVSNPSAPAHLQTLSTGGAGPLVVSNGHAYLGYLYGLQSIDVSDPSNMVLTGELPVCVQGLFDLTSVDGYVLGAWVFGSIRTFDVTYGTIPDAIVELANDERDLRDLAVAGNLLSSLEYYQVWDGYGFEEYTAVETWDVEVLDAPAPVNTRTFVGSYERVATDGAIVAVASDEEVVFYGLSTASFFSDLGTVLLDDVQDVLLDGGFAWITTAGSGLAVVDLANPNAVSAWLPTNGGLSGIARMGSVMVVGDNASGLLVVDADPAAPSVLASSYGGGGLGDVAVEGAYAYARDPEGYSLHVFDLTDPMSPSHLASTWDLRTGSGLVSLGGVVFAGGTCVTHVIDAGDPAHPVNLGTIPHQRAGSTRGVTSASGRIFVGSAGYTSSLVQVFPGPCSSPTAVPPAVVRPRAALRGSPNPFQESTTLTFELGRREPIVLSVFDVTGRRIRRIDPGLLGPGSHRLDWDGHDERGRAVPAGVYFVRLNGAGRETARVVRIR